MKSKIEDKTLSLYLEGRVDSNSAPQIQKEIDEEIAKYPHENLVINAKELEYISSAGLRVVLRLKQTDKTLKIINANQAVYEVLDMTGFTEFMEVSRAYRKLSVDGCEIIGKGAKGTVYRYDKETVVKVYNNPDSLEAIQNERNLAREAFVLGIPTAISYDIARIDGKFGSVFELLDTKSYSQLIKDDPDNTDTYVSDYANLLRQIHDTMIKPGSMPDYRPKANKWFSVAKPFLPESTATKLGAMIEAIPDRGTMLHCDYHTNNLMQMNGEALIIDMDTLSHGHPIFELANTYTAHKGFSETMPEMTEGFLQLPISIANNIWDRFLPKYLGTDDKAVIQDVEDKTRLLAYVRIIQHIVRRNDHETEEGKKHLDYYVNQVISLTEKIDNFEFEKQ